MKKKLLLVSPLPDEFVLDIEKRFPELIVVDLKNDRARVTEEIETTHYFFGRPSRDEFNRAKCLEFIQVWTQGIEGILFPELIKSSVWVSNGKGIWSPAIAEHILALVLALYRRLPDYLRFQEQAAWVQKGIRLNRLFGKTVCFIGTGDIAQHTLSLLKGFSCRILGVNRSGACPVGFHQVAKREDMLPLISVSDVVVAALPFTAETQRFVDRDVFAAMKNTCIFVNVGRGKTVDESALIAALQEKRIAGAGLDVMETEPPDASNPLLHMSNVIVTAHVAGLDEEHPQRAFELLCENLQRVLNGQPPKNLVDKVRGY